MFAPACLFERSRSCRAAAFFTRRSPNCLRGQSMRKGRTSRVEAPRGEVMYSVSWEEDSDNPSRVHVRTPTYANMPAIRAMVIGAQLAETPLIQASIDPCYSCTDR